MEEAKKFFEKIMEIIKHNLTYSKETLKEYYCTGFSIDLSKKRRVPRKLKKKLKKEGKWKLREITDLSEITAAYGNK